MVINKAHTLVVSVGATRNFVPVSNAFRYIFVLFDVERVYFVAQNKGGKMLYYCDNNKLVISSFD